MENSKRRTALALAREQALMWANRAEAQFNYGDYASNQHYIEMSRMWSDVANAMKVGDERADNV